MKAVRNRCFIKHTCETSVYNYDKIITCEIRTVQRRMWFWHWIGQDSFVVVVGLRTCESVGASAHSLNRGNSVSITHLIHKHTILSFYSGQDFVVGRDPISVLQACVNGFKKNLLTVTLLTSFLIICQSRRFIFFTLFIISYKAFDLANWQSALLQVPGTHFSFRSKFQQLVDEWTLYEGHVVYK